jgi:hypothetical protein
VTRPSLWQAPNCFADSRKVRGESMIPLSASSSDQRSGVLNRSRMGVRLVTALLHLLQGRTDRLTYLLAQSC